MADRILLVEDDPVNVKFIQVVLTRKGGFEVVVCEEVDEILRIAREDPPVLVIMDVSLTRSTWEGRKVDGLHITKLLKQDPATARVPPTSPPRNRRRDSSSWLTGILRSS